jgi:hypothetical protein
MTEKAIEPAYWGMKDQERLTCTDPDEAIEEYLDDVEHCRAWLASSWPGVRNKRDKLAIAHATRMTEPCEWKEDEDGIWWTACGNAYEYINGGPAENGQKFCGYCGKPLKEVEYKEPKP